MLPFLACALDGVFQRWVSLVLLAGAALIATPSRALDAGNALTTPPSGVTSVVALRDAGVVKQRYDYSCGAAALATLLTYGLSDPVDEPAILSDVLVLMSADEQSTVKRLGLSLLDLQRLAERRGHKAQGFKIAADDLPKLLRPVIVFIRPGGHPHFAVLKGVRGDRAFLADPSLGNVRMPLYRFLDMWADAAGRGIVFAVEPKNGAWPDTYALQTPDRTNSMEALTARRLFETAKPFQGDHGIR